MPSENVELSVTAKDDASKTLDAVAKKAEGLAGSEAKVSVGADDKASGTLDDVGQSAESLGNTAVDISVDADDQASGTLSDVGDSASALADTEVEIPLGADDQASGVLSDVADAAGDLAGTEVDIPLGADDNASAVIEDVAAATEPLAEPVVVEITANADASIADIQALGEELVAAGEQAAALGQESVTIVVTTDEIDSARELLTDMGADIQSISDTAITVTVDASEVSAAGAEIAALGNTADEAGTKAFKGTGKLKALGKALGGVSGLQGDANKAVTGLFALSTTLEQVLPEASGLTAALGPVGLAIGIVGLAAGVATTLIDALGDSSGATADQINAMKDAALSAEGPLKGFKTNIDDIFRSNEDLSDATQKLGIDQTEFGNAVKGDVSPAIQDAKEIYDEYTDAINQGERSHDWATQELKIERIAAAHHLSVDELKRLYPAYKTVTQEIETQSDAFEKGGGKASDYQASLEQMPGQAWDLTEAIEAQNTQWDAYVTGQTQVAAATKATSEAAKAQAKNLKDLQTGLRSLKSPLLATADAADGFSAAFSAQRSALFDIHTTYGEVETGIGGLVTQLKEAPQAFKDTNSHITSFSATGKEVLGTLEGLNSKLGANFDAVIKSGGTYDDVRAKAATYREELGNQFDQLGITKDEQEAYLTQLGLTPKQIETTIKLSQQAEAFAQLAQYQGLIDTLVKSDPTLYVKYKAFIDAKDFVGAENFLQGLTYDPATGTWREAHYTTSADTSDATVTLQKVTDGTYQATVDVDGNPVEVHATLQQIHDGGYDTTVTVNGEPHPARVAIKQVEDGSYTATITVQAVGLQGIMDRFQSLTSKTITVTTLHEDGTHGTMAGGPRGPGYYTINEAGQEVVFLPGGSEVMTAGQVMTAGGLGGGTTIINNHFNVSVPLGASKAAVGAQIADALDSFYRTSGNRTRLRSV